MDHGSYAATRVGWTLYGNGTLPWNRTDNMVVTVELDPDFIAMPTDLSCEDGFEFGATPCTSDSSVCGKAVGNRVASRLRANTLGWDSARAVGP